MVAVNAQRARGRAQGGGLGSGLKNSANCTDSVFRNYRLQNRSRTERRLTAHMHEHPTAMRHAPTAGAARASRHADARPRPGWRLRLPTRSQSQTQFVLNSSMIFRTPLSTGDVRRTRQQCRPSYVTSHIGRHLTYMPYYHSDNLPVCLATGPSTAPTRTGQPLSAHLAAPRAPDGDREDTYPACTRTSVQPRGTSRPQRPCLELCRTYTYTHGRCMPSSTHTAPVPVTVSCVTTFTAQRRQSTRA